MGYGRNSLILTLSLALPRVMNLLQSTSMAYPLVNESNVYLCSGSPMPADMTLIYESLLNDGLMQGVEKISKISKEKVRTTL